MKPTDNNLLPTLCQDTSPIPSLDGTAELSPSWKLLRFGMELAITSWLAHQIIVRVVRVFNVSVFTADIKAESSVKKKQRKQKCKKWIKLSLSADSCLWTTLSCSVYIHCQHFQALESWEMAINYWFTVWEYNNEKSSISDYSFKQKKN